MSLFHKKYKPKFSDDYFNKLYRSMPDRIGINVKNAIEAIQGNRSLINEYGKDFEFEEEPRITIAKAFQEDIWEKQFDKGNPLYLKAKTKYAQEKYTDSIGLCRQALNVGYTNANVYERMAMCYRKLKQYDDEIAILQEGLMQFKKQNEPASDSLEESFNYRIARATILKEKSENK